MFRKDMREESIRDELNELGTLIQSSLLALEIGSKPKCSLKEAEQKIVNLDELIFVDEREERAKKKQLEEDMSNKFKIIDIEKRKPDKDDYYACLFIFTNNPGKYFIASKRFDTEMQEFYSDNKDAKVIAWFDLDVRIFNPVATMEMLPPKTRAKLPARKKG